MTLHPADKADHAAIIAFLRAHEASSIFPLANLVGSGPSPQQLWRVGMDRVRGVIALGSSGFLMPQWPGLDADAVLTGLKGQRVAAAIGEASQIEALLPHLPQPRHLSREPLCTLALDQLAMPDPQGTVLAPIRAEDAETAIRFRLAYDRETMGLAEGPARAKAEADVHRWIAGQSHRLLWRDGHAVAMTGLNARLPDVVQVGGVYTPPDLRGQGLARRAVALHLDEARAAGAQRAVLFAATEAALRAYRAIGFGQIGWMRLALFSGAVLL